MQDRRPNKQCLLITAQLALSPWLVQTNCRCTGALECAPFPVLVVGLSRESFRHSSSLGLRGYIPCSHTETFLRHHSAQLSPAGLLFPPWETSHCLYHIKYNRLLLYTLPCLSLWAAPKNSQARSPHAIQEHAGCSVFKYGSSTSCWSLAYFSLLQQTVGCHTSISYGFWKRKIFQRCFKISATASTAPILGKI